MCLWAAPGHGEANQLLCAHSLGGSGVPHLHTERTQTQTLKGR